MPIARRIVSLLASGTEILYGVGAGADVIGVSHECDWPPEALGKPRLTFSRIDSRAASRQIDEQVRERIGGGEPLYEIDRQRLIDLQPELIVTQSQCDVCAVRYEDVVQLVQQAPQLDGTRIVSLNPQRLDDVLQDVIHVGTAAGRPAQAERFAEQLRERMARLQQQGSGPNRPRVACIEWIDPLMIAANWTPELVALAGGCYGMAQAGQHSSYTRWEALVQYDPELIVVAPCGFDLQRTLAESATLVRHPGWHDLAAVRNARVFALDGSAFLNRSGPRLVDSAELLAAIIHETGTSPSFQRL